MSDSMNDGNHDDRSFRPGEIFRPARPDPALSVSGKPGSEDAPRFARLEARLLAAQAAVRSAREELIEMMGDRLCGSGEGPTLQALCAFDDARCLEEEARHALAALATESAFESLLVSVAPKNRPRTPRP